MFIMDNQLYSNKKIHNFELEMNYWSKYICGLYDYLMYGNPTPNQKKMIADEIVRVNFHIDARKKNIETWLGQYKFSKENKLKFKQFKNETKQSIN